MTRKGECNWKSNSFVTAAEQVCLQPVLKHWQRRGRRNFAWQAIPHLCSSNRKGTTADSWPTTGRNVKLLSGGGPEPASVWHVGDICEWRQRVRWCRTMQCTIRQRRHLEYNLLRHTEPMKAEECVGDVVTTSQVENVPSVLWCCWLGGRKGIRPVKNWAVGCWRGFCLQRGADLHMAQRMPLPLTVSCFSKIQIGFAFLVPAHPGSPRHPLNGCVCVYIHISMVQQTTK